MMTTISWVDHDEHAQQQARRILDDFAEKSAVDELGLGVVRDAIAEALYPGVSTLHRRPRYLLFVAWTYRDLLHSGRSGAAAVELGRRHEHTVRRALTTHYGARGDQEGIIGLRAGESLKRLPSAVYWAALRRYGIRHEGASGSVDAYCRLLAGRAGGRRREALLRRDDDAPEDLAQLWAELPEPDPGRHESVSFDLTGAEARFLRERLMRSEVALRSPDEQSLLSWFAQQPSWHDDVDPTALVDDPGLPARTREVLRWSRLFDQSVHGARLLYNLMCAERTHQDDLCARYRAELTTWHDDTRAIGLPGTWPAHEFWGWVSRWRHSGIRRVQGFHDAWMRRLAETELVVDDDMPTRSLLVDREVALKRSLARLYPGPSRRLDQYDGDAGLGRYDYNWSIARRTLDDLHAGLGHGAGA